MDAQVIALALEHEEVLLHNTNSGGRGNIKQSTRRCWATIPSHRRAGGSVAGGL